VYSAEMFSARSTRRRGGAVRRGLLLAEVVPGPRGIVTRQLDVVSSFLLS
jgi:hypothetical protein